MRTFRRVDGAHAAGCSADARGRKSSVGRKAIPTRRSFSATSIWDSFGSRKKIGPVIAGLAAVTMDQEPGLRAGGLGHQRACYRAFIDLRSTSAFRGAGIAGSLMQKAEEVAAGTRQSAVLACRQELAKRSDPAALSEAGLSACGRDQPAAQARTALFLLRKAIQRVD